MKSLLFKALLFTAVVAPAALLLVRPSVADPTPEKTLAAGQTLRTFKYYQPQEIVLVDDDDDGYRKRVRRYQRLVEQDRYRSRTAGYRRILDEDDDGDRRRLWNRYHYGRPVEDDDD